jgi:prephenate dehydrogenase
LRIWIVGADGGMGRWLTRHLVMLGYAVSSIDTRTDPLDQLSELDLVIVSVPISATPGVIHVIAPIMRCGAVLAEIASLKDGSHAALAEAARFSVNPLCIYPMFGPSTPSPKGHVVAVVPVEDTEGERGLAEEIFPGADFVTLIVTRHDRCMAVVLSLPYEVNLALARALGGEDLELVSRIAGPIFALEYTLAQSIAGENPTLTRDLLNCNVSLRPLSWSFEDSLSDVVWASRDGARFDGLHAKIVEALSQDPSFESADGRRQHANRAIAGA